MENLTKNCDWEHVSTDSPPVLQDNELHVWWSALTLSPSQSELTLSLLSDLQRDKYNRRATKQGKHNYLAGRYYLLHLLAAYTDQSAHEIQLTYNRLNKPSLSDESLKLQFNFTDTAGHGVFVFTKHQQVGVDIEHLDRQANFKMIANKRFTEQERNFVYKDGKIDNQRCLAIWTRKEAFGKAAGVGINFQMNQRNLYDKQCRGEDFKFVDNGNAWTCLQLALGDTFISSVVYEGHKKLNVRAFKPQKI